MQTVHLTLKACTSAKGRKTYLIDSRRVSADKYRMLESLALSKDCFTSDGSFTIRVTETHALWYAPK